MMGLIGKKIGMTQLFDEKGDCVPVTVIECGPCVVTEVRSKERDGYTALQLGFGTNKESRFTKPVLGQFKKRNLVPSRHLREFRVADVSGHEVGQTLKADLFTKGEYVDVQGVTKGRGFAGVIKRHGMKGEKRTHGNHESFRGGGSVGCRMTPGRVLPGKKMPGQMGNEKVTVQNLRIAKVLPEKGLILVRGAVPGGNNGYVEICQIGRASCRERV